MQLVDAGTGEIIGDEQALIVVSGKFEFTENGLIVHGSPTFQECASAYQQISRFGQLTQVFLGDLLNYMEGRWGDKYAQVLEATGYSYQTAANAKSVMAHVPIEARPEGGTYFAHYEAVRSLEPPEQKRLLESAKREGWNSADLRQKARRIKREQSSPDFLPTTVRMAVNMTFTVPSTLNGKLRDSLERLADRLKEWDIECESLNISEAGT